MSFRDPEPSASPAPSARSEDAPPNGAAPDPPAGYEVLHGEEELTLENVGAFRDRVFTAIGRRPAHLCLDLTPCVYVDTSGLASLVTAVRVARLVQVGVTIVPAPHLRRVLTVSGLIRVLPIAPLAAITGSGSPCPPPPPPPASA